MNTDKYYFLNEKIRHIKKDSMNVYQFFSLGILAIMFIAAYILYIGHYIAGVLLLGFCFIGFFMLFPAQQVTKDIEEIEKQVSRLTRNN